jgi:hypothetical protein
MYLLVYMSYEFCCSMMVATTNCTFLLVLCVFMYIFFKHLQYIQEDNGVVPLPCALE